MLVVVGVLAALDHARRTGQGQVVDAAMVDGAALLLTMQRTMAAQGLWNGGRGGNLLDTGAPFYDVYETADGLWVSVGALEPQFFAALLARLDLADEFADGQDPRRWPALRARLAEVFAGRTRAAWDEVFAGSDACYAPVLSMHEAPAHEHNVARAAFVEVDGDIQARPAPRFDRTPTADPTPATAPGAHTRDVLLDAGFTPAEVEQLLAGGAVAEP
jgi:alpha-methylacyl-CoA racemase